MEKYVTTDAVTKKFMVVLKTDDDTTHTWLFDTKKVAQQFLDKIKQQHSRHNACCVFDCGSEILM